MACIGMVYIVAACIVLAYTTPAAQQRFIMAYLYSDGLYRYGLWSLNDALPKKVMACMYGLYSYGLCGNGL